MESLRRCDTCVLPEHVEGTGVRIPEPPHGRPACIQHDDLFSPARAPAGACGENLHSGRSAWKTASAYSSDPREGSGFAHGSAPIPPLPRTFRRQKRQAQYMGHNEKRASLFKPVQRCRGPPRVGAVPRVTGPRQSQCLGESRRRMERFAAGPWYDCDPDARRSEAEVLGSTCVARQRARPAWRGRHSDTARRTWTDGQEALKRRDVDERDRATCEEAPRGVTRGCAHPSGNVHPKGPSIAGATASREKWPCHGA